jgi:hypothetical protein
MQRNKISRKQQATLQQATMMDDESDGRIVKWRSSASSSILYSIHSKQSTRCIIRHSNHTFDGKAFSRLRAQGDDIINMIDRYRVQDISLFASFLRNPKWWTREALHIPSRSISGAKMLLSRSIHHYPARLDSALVAGAFLDGMAEGVGQKGWWILGGVSEGMEATLTWTRLTRYGDNY